MGTEYQGFAIETKYGNPTSTQGGKIRAFRFNEPKRYKVYPIDHSLSINQRHIEAAKQFVRDAMETEEPDSMDYSYSDTVNGVLVIFHFKHQD